MSMVKSLVEGALRMINEHEDAAAQAPAVSYTHLTLPTNREV